MLIPLNFELKKDFDLWQKFIISRNDSHCTDLAEWRLLFRELYDIKNYSFAFREDGKTRGVISLYHIKSPMMGDMLVTCPFFGYGGFYYDNVQTRDDLLRTILSIAQKLNVDFIEIRLKNKLPEPYKHNTEFLEFDLNLPNSAQEVWKNSLSSNVRQNIRKAQNNALQFRISQNYKRCHRLLSQTLRDHGTPFHGEHFFKLLKRYFKDNVYFTEVWDNEQHLAGGVIIKFKDQIITPYIGSKKSGRNSGSNYCQYWGIIKHCFDHGIKRFDLGRSPKGSTHVKFKEKWSAKRVQVYYNYFMINPKKKYQSVIHPSRLFLIAVDIWKRLPLFLTSKIGPHVFRYIP